MFPPDKTVEERLANGVFARYASTPRMDVNTIGLEDTVAWRVEGETKGSSERMKVHSKTAGHCHSGSVACHDHDQRFSNLCLRKRLVTVCPHPRTARNASARILHRLCSSGCHPCLPSTLSLITLTRCVQFCHSEGIGGVHDE